MTIALVTHGIAQSANSLSVTTAGLNTTGATLLVMVVANYNAVSPPAVSDSKGNTWVQRTTYGGASSTSGASATVFYSTTGLVGTGHTFTASAGGSTYPSICVLAFSGASPAYDVENGNNGSTSPTATGSVTPSRNNSVLVTGIACNGNIGGATIDSSFAITDEVNVSPGAAEGIAAAYKVQTTAAAENPKWTVSSTNLTAAIASFKPPASQVWPYQDTEGCGGMSSLSMGGL